MRVPSRILILPLALALVSSAGIAHAAWPTAPTTGVTLCAATGDQSPSSSSAVSDGAGGAFVAWWDFRSGVNSAIYITRVTSSGTIAAGWPADGFPVCLSTGYRSIDAVLAGPGGDVYVVWDDFRAGPGLGDIYAQRITSAGAVAAGWPVNGLALTNDSRNQRYGHACVDGAGGLYATWVLAYSSTDDDLYLTRVLPNGTFASGFAVNGIAVNGSGLNQSNPDIAADGLGNAIVSYTNYDGTYYHPWVQKVGPAGGFAIAYPGRDLAPTAAQSYYGGHVVTGASGGGIVGFNISGAQGTDGPIFVFLDAALNTRMVVQPKATSYYDAMRSMVADGSGGAFAQMAQNDLSSFNYNYLEHITSSGATVPAYPGAYFYSDMGSYQVALATGAEGTGLVAWSGAANSGAVQMQRMDAAGNTLWPAPSVALGTGNESVAAIVPDATGGAIVTYADSRNGSYDVYATKVDRFGYLGDAAPAITRISDVTSDNGGQVSLQWTPSYLDASPDFGIARYSIWRRVPGGTLAARLQKGARTIGMNEARPAGDGAVIRVQTEGLQVIGWEYVASIPARGYPAYSVVAPTTSDSMGSGNPRTSFRVQAETSNGIPFWDSAADSGYSVDNLPPVAPAPFSGTYSAGTSTLTWTANAETDMGTYRLYRGTSSTFVPGPGNLVVTKTTPGYVDVAGGAYWYKLAAVDMHGNVSPYSTLLPQGATAVDATAPLELAFARPTPNPARGAVSLGFSLPRAAAVRLEVFDPSGRRVRTLAEGQWPAGEHVLRWDGRDASGAAAGPGLYFVRLTAEGRRFDQRVALIR